MDDLELLLVECEDKIIFRRCVKNIRFSEIPHTVDSLSLALAREDLHTTLARSRQDTGIVKFLMVAVAGIHIAVESQRFWYLEATSEAARPIFPSTHAANYMLMTRTMVLQSHSFSRLERSSKWMLV